MLEVLSSRILIVAWKSLLRGRYRHTRGKLPLILLLSDPAAHKRKAS